MTTHKELLAQKAALDKQIEIARKAEAAAALTSIHQLIADFGFTAQQVFPWKAPAQRRKLEPKFRDPVTGATWSGRGMTPKWMKGKDREQFLIE